MHPNIYYRTIEIMGVKRGNLLEPSMGIGNFFGAIPGNLSNSFKLYGVEIDPITAEIAKLLYPNSDIRIQGFENTTFPDNFFDVAIGNVPFGDYKVYDKNNKFPDYVTDKIHNYFFAKAIEKVKLGGIIAFITSTGTLYAAYRLPMRN